MCAHCCKYIDPDFDPKVESAVPAAIQALQEQEDFQRRRAAQNGHPDQDLFTLEGGVESVEISEDVLADLEEPSDVKRAGQFRTLQSRNFMAMEAIQQELDKEKAVAKFEEVKYSTEAEMDALLNSL